MEKFYESWYIKHNFNSYIFHSIGYTFLRNKILNMSNLLIYL